MHFLTIQPLTRVAQNWKLARNAALLALTAATGCATTGLDEPQTVFAEDFDNKAGSEFQDQLLEKEQVHLAPGQGVDGSNAVRVSYVGSRVGSERVVFWYPLTSPLRASTLRFRVKFEEDFQWTIGGKLHGVGPKRPITGGRKRKPKGWSSRIMFREDGQALSYIYDQDSSKKYGTNTFSCGPVFRKDTWHTVELTTFLNDPGYANGWAAIKVDGVLKVVDPRVEYRRYGDDDTLIQKFLFSTFHGGGSSDWAPKTVSGEYATVHALFDDFEIEAFDGSVDPNQFVSCEARERLEIATR